MNEILTNPIFIIVAIILILIIIGVILLNQLKNSRRQILRTMNENRDYLENKVPVFENIIENAINVHITNQELIKELTRIKEQLKVDFKNPTTMIVANNEIYKLINNPLIKAEEFKDVDEALTNAFNENYVDTIVNERKEYNTKATAFNTKITTFPSSVFAKITNSTALPLFEDVVSKTTENINNSVSYLSNNYNINQSTIQSPEIKPEETSNLFIAKQSKPIENSVNITESSIPETNIQAPVDNISEQPPVAPVVEVSTPNDNNFNEPITINEETPFVTKTTEPISINEDNSSQPNANQEIQQEKMPSGESSTNQISTNDIEIVNSATPNITEPISINNENEAPIDLNNNVMELVNGNDNVIKVDNSATEVAVPNNFENTMNENSLNVKENNNGENTSTKLENAEEQPKPQRFCPNCNKLTTEKFCPDCGYPTE